MPTNWQERLLREREELAEKFQKLSQFLDYPNQSTASEEDVKLLSNQRAAMQLYLSILDQRCQRACLYPDSSRASA